MQTQGFWDSIWAPRCSTTVMLGHAASELAYFDHVMGSAPANQHVSVAFAPSPCLLVYPSSSPFIAPWLLPMLCRSPSFTGQCHRCMPLWQLSFQHQAQHVWHLASQPLFGTISLPETHFTVYRVIEDSCVLGLERPKLTFADMSDTPLAWLNWCHRAACVRSCCLSIFCFGFTIFFIVIDSSLGCK